MVKPPDKILLTVLLMVSVWAWSDVIQVRDELMSGDPTLVAQALQTVDTLGAGDRKLLVSELKASLLKDGVSAQAAAVPLAHCPKEAQDALPELVEALRYDDPAVTATVGETLVKIGAAAVHPLTRALSDPNFIVRQRAATLLGNFGPAASPAAFALAVLLLDPQYDVHNAAESTLIKVGEPAVPAVTDLLNRVDEGGRKTLITFLGRLGPTAAPILVHTLQKDENIYVRISAASALGEVHPVTPVVVSALIDALKSTDDNLRAATVEALTQLGADAKAAIGSLIVHSHQDPEALVRQRSLDALGKIGRPAKESLPGLIESLKLNDAAIRQDVLKALGQADIPFDQTFPLLMLALKDPDPTVRQQAIQSTAALAPKEPKAVLVLKTALADAQPENRIAAIQTFGECAAAPSPAAEALEDVLIKDQDAATRGACIASLAKLGPSAVPALLFELKDSYAVLAAEARQAIIQIGPDAVPALQKAQITLDPLIQKLIPDLIGQIQNPESAPKHHAHKKSSAQ